jgi:hypothetical protein
MHRRGKSRGTWAWWACSLRWRSAWSYLTSFSWSLLVPWYREASKHLCACLHLVTLLLQWWRWTAATGSPVFHACHGCFWKADLSTNQPGWFLAFHLSLCDVVGINDLLRDADECHVDHSEHPLVNLVSSGSTKYEGCSSHTWSKPENALRVSEVTLGYTGILHLEIYRK